MNVCFEPRRDLTEAVSRLCELDGVGEWTAQYIAMRALGETDAFLAADIGVQRGLGRERTATEDSGTDCAGRALAGRGALTPRCISGWLTRTVHKSNLMRRSTMRLRLDKYDSPVSQLLVVTDEEGQLCGRWNLPIMNRGCIGCCASIMGNMN